MSPKIIKKTFNKPFIIAIGIILIIFIILNFFVKKMIEDHFYTHIEREAKNLSAGYTSSMSKAIMARQIINDLLTEKILTASQAASVYGDIVSNQDVKEFAEILNVDEINTFNRSGTLLYSTDPSLVGWEAYPGHPIYSFMQSEQNQMIENIRANVVNAVLYKYGYFKTSDGSIVQIGIKAEKMNSFLDEFNIHNIFKHIHNDEDILSISFLNNKHFIIESTDHDLINKKIVNYAINKLEQENTQVGLTENTNKSDVYTIYTPVVINNERIGILAITQELSETTLFMKRYTYMGYIAVTLICLSLFFIFSFTQKKNDSLYNMAYYDPLTKLPNNRFLKEKIDFDKDVKQFLLLINFSNFRIMNITHGYEYGDLLLKAIGKRLEEFNSTNIIPARLNADIFVMYVTDYNKEEVEKLAKDISISLTSVFEIRDTKKYLESKIGIVHLNRNHNFDTAIKNSLIAMNHISNNSANKYTFFDTNMEINLKREELIESEIREYIEDNNDNIYLVYQPQLDLKRNKITGIEALARMKSKYFGNVTPLEFIHIAEKASLIIPLGNMILKSACKFINKLETQGLDTKVAVNISGIQLLDEDFSENIIRLINETDINPDKLELEITESILLNNFDLINKRLRELRKNGIEIALDDFGKGYSSFFRLDELNVNSLKIDKSFIDKITTRNEDELIISELIAMAHKFNLKVVAEGVENKSELDYLKENNCDIIQGYLFSKPISDSEIITLLRNFEPSPDVK